MAYFSFSDGLEIEVIDPLKINTYRNVNQLKCLPTQVNFDFLRQGTKAAEPGEGGGLKGWSPPPNNSGLLQHFH